MLRLNSYFALFIIGALFLNGCVKSSQNEKEMRPVKIDTLQVTKTIEFMLFSTGKIQPSTISGLFDDLRKKKQYNLLNQYLLAYNNTNPLDPEIKGVVTLYKGLICNDKMQYDSAKRYYDEAIYSFTYAKNPQWLVKALIASADNAGELGDFEKAIIERYHAINILNLRTYETYEKFTQIGDLGDDYLNIDKTSVAIELIDSALTYFYQINDSAKIADMLSAKSYALLLTGDFDRSLNHAKHSLKIRKLIRDSLKIAEAYNNFAVSEMSGKHWQEALSHLEIAEKMFRELNYEKEQHKILLNKGHCFFQLGDKEKALASLQKALDMSSERNQLNEVKVALQTIAYIYSKYGDYKNAYLYYVKYNAAKDAVFSKEKEMAIRDIITKSKMAQNEQKLLLISTEKEYAEQTKKIFTWLLIVSILLGFSVIAALLTRYHKNKQLYFARQQMQALEIEKLQHESDLNRKALDNFTRNLISKSKLVEELEEKINQYERKNDRNELLGNINQLKTMRILTDDDWKSFKEYFEKCYPGFIFNLKQKFLDLSPAELRLMLLIRLDLDSRDTASMLGISPDSVKKARYRLKKKLDLGETEDLDRFVCEI